MPRPKAPPYLAFELDALPRSDLAARSAGVDDGLAARALLSVWEYAWREQVEWIRPEVLLGCCRGNARLAEALAAVGFGFLEPVPAGWTSEPCTPEPIPVSGHRIRGARRYLRIGSPQSLGGHAAKANLRQYSGRNPADVPSDAPAGEPAASRHQRTANSEQRESQQQHLAGAVAPASRSGSEVQEHHKTAGDAGVAHTAAAPAGQPPPPAPSQTPTAPANVAQEPAQAVLDGVPERPAKAKRSKPDEKPTSPHFRALSDRLVTGYLRRVGRAYKFQGAKDGEALKRLCAVIDSGAATVEEVGAMFERALVVDFNPVTGIANFEARFNDPRWAADSAAPRDVRRGTVRAEDEHHEQGGSICDF